nr:hypothetical protein [uncultured bacterium]
MDDEKDPFEFDQTLDLSGLSIADLVALRSWALDKYSTFALMMMAGPKNKDACHLYGTLDFIASACDEEMFKRVIPSICEGYEIPYSLVQRDINEEDLGSDISLNP